MKPLADAQREVLAGVARLEAVDVELRAALGLVLAEDVIAPHDVPPFANAAMDGFAVMGADVAAAGVELEILEDLAAGHVASAAVRPRTAIRIMTGAPLPAGADTVVRVEDTESDDRRVRIAVPVPTGTAVRAAGGDVTAGSVVFRTGTVLAPAHVGVLATIGVTRPRVFRNPRVAIMSTGDEVVPPETATLAPGTIRDANRPLLAGLLAEVGVDIEDFGIVGDDRDRLRSMLASAASDCDVVVSSGGVSMGDYDLVKHVLAELGSVELWKVAMQPAKPFAFGSIEGTPLFGLPGNPVSVIVAFENFLRPALLAMRGCQRLFRPLSMGVWAETVETDPAKTVFLRVVRVEGGVRLAGGQDSNVLSATANADAWAVVGTGIGKMEAGEAVPLLEIRLPASRTYLEVLA
ncbi:MAG TPA: gephyrin-like molybdotransferase Glp [Acidimicrobiia bacterium]|nr:gephyrin-like molybdotransferase Glp [Acidimicrobiia bacterium]